jgi:signal transduction histidine kinase
MSFKHYLRKRNIKLSAQVFSLVSLLAMVPWVGYQVILEAKQFLESGQMVAQEQFSRSVANAFYGDTESLTLTPMAQVALPMAAFSEPMSIDGSTQDWKDQGAKSTSFPLRQRPDGLGFNISIGERKGELFGLIEVQDDTFDDQTPLINGHGTRDHLRMEWRSSQGYVERVIMVPQPGRFLAIFKADKNWKKEMINLFTTIPLQASIGPTALGYAVEFKINTELLNEKLEMRFAVFDGATQSGISSMSGSNGFHQINTRSSKAHKVLNSLSKPVSHIALYDKDFNLRAQTQAAPNITKKLTDMSFSEALSSIVDNAMIALLRLAGSNDAALSQTQLLVEARRGELAQSRWASIGGSGFLTTAAPVMSEQGYVIGMVLIKQSTDKLVKLQLKSIQNIMFFGVLGLLIVFAIVFFLFWRLTYRVRKLRLETTKMINKKGELVTNKLVSQIGEDDSIGDLARSFSDVVAKLHEQQSFMATMPRTLSHEIKNPLNAISTSLENISDYPLDAEIKRYTDIAKRGLTKIDSILAKLSSAANLEQALVDDELERLDINYFLTAYCNAQKESIGEHLSIVYASNAKPAWVNAVDFRLEQALDKLIDNAKDFATPASVIKVRLQEEELEWVIEVENQGELLKPDDKGQLFHSMVTSRSQANAGGEGHFGLGLYVVKTIATFHQGSATAHNLEDGSGVVFSIRLPSIFG